MNCMETIEWAEPPNLNSTKRTKGYLERFATELRKNPGKWAYYGNGASATATRMRRVYGLDTRMVNTGSGRGDIYARWEES